MYIFLYIYRPQGAETNTADTSGTALYSITVPPGSPHELIVSISPTGARSCRDQPGAYGWHQAYHQGRWRIVHKKRLSKPTNNRGVYCSTVIFFRGFSVGCTVARQKSHTIPLVSKLTIKSCCQCRKNLELNFEFCGSWDQLRSTRFQKSCNKNPRQKVINGME